MSSIPVEHRVEDSEIKGTPNDESGPNGKVEIRIKGAGDADKETLIEICDNGCGISQQDMKRIFQPFFTTKEKGTGLGLSIVKKIMEDHGFGISVSSEEGAGTVVVLSVLT